MPSVTITCINIDAGWNWWEYFPAFPPDKVAKVVTSDGDTSYIYETISGQRQMFTTTVPDIPDDATIVNVSVIAECKANNLPCYVDIRVEVSGSPFYSENFALDNSAYADYTYSMNENPRTKSPWQEADLAGFKMGLQRKVPASSGNQARCTYLRAIATYSEPEDEDCAASCFVTDRGNEPCAASAAVSESKDNNCAGSTYVLEQPTEDCPASAAVQEKNLTWPMAASARIMEIVSCSLLASCAVAYSGQVSTIDAYAAIQGPATSNCAASAIIAEPDDSNCSASSYIMDRIYEPIAVSAYVQGDMTEHADIGASGNSAIGASQWSGKELYGSTCAASAAIAERFSNDCAASALAVERKDSICPASAAVKFYESSNISTSAHIAEDNINEPLSASAAVQGSEDSNCAASARVIYYEEEDSANCAASCRVMNVRYINAAATGAGTGLNWTDAYPTFHQARLAGWLRNCVYFVASGDYTPISGEPSYVGITHAAVAAQWTIIKKASTTEHGTSVGWQASYGIGQASITFTEMEGFFITTSYVAIDGAYRTNETSGHGFKIYHPVEPGAAYSLHVQRPPTPSEKWLFQYIEIQGPPVDSGHIGVFFRAPDTGVHFKDAIVRYCYFYQCAGNALKVDCGNYEHPERPNLNNLIVENNYFFEVSISAAVGHGEIMTAAAMDNCIIRNNKFIDWAGSGGLMCEGDGNEVYNNIFAYTNNIPTLYAGTGVYGRTEDYTKAPITNLKFYNNTMYNLFADNSGISAGRPEDYNNRAYNNIIYHADEANMIVDANGEADYNYYYDYDKMTQPYEPHGEYISSDPSLFVDDTPAAPDLHLAKATGPGITNPGFTLWPTDLDGVTRGEDGLWDKGVYEYDAGADNIHLDASAAIQQQGVTSNISASAYITSQEAKIAASAYVEEGEETDSDLAISARVMLVRYINAAATGAGTGLSWTDAYPSFSAVQVAGWVRNCVYYVAGGSYAGNILCNAANIGTQWIFIQKATATQHGTETGWQASYGTNQAVVTVPTTGSNDYGIRFTTSYWKLTGVTRSTLTSGHGIKFYNPNTGMDRSIAVRDQTAPQSHIIVEYVESQGPMSDGDMVHFHIDTNTSGDSCTYLTYRYNYCHSGGKGIFQFVQWSSTAKALPENIIIEESYFADVYSVSVAHGECISGCAANNVIVRNNHWVDWYAAAAALSFEGDNWQIYNNLFYYTDNFAGDYACNHGIVGRWNHPYDRAPITNCRFYGNTMFNLYSTDGLSHHDNYGVRLNQTEDAYNEVYNNIWYNVETLGIADGKHGVDANGVMSHNYYYNVGETPIPEVGYEYYTVDPELFTDDTPPTIDLHLTKATGQGMTDPGWTMYPTDLDGVTRGGDGLWDKGAYEYESSGVQNSHIGASARITGVMDVLCAASTIVFTELDVDSNCPASAAVQSSESQPVTGSAIVADRLSANIEASAAVQAATDSNCSAFTRVIEIEGTPCAASAAVQSAESSPISGSAAIAEPNTSPCAASAAVQSQGETSNVSGSAIVGEPGSTNISSSACVSGSIDSNCSASSAVQGTSDITCSMSASVRHTWIVQIFASARVKGPYDSPIPASACVQEIATESNISISAYVNLGRIYAMDVYGSLYQHCVDSVSACKFYPPWQEPSVTSLNAWAVVSMDLTDRSSRSNEWIGDGTLTIEINARKKKIDTSVNFYSAMAIANQLSDAFSQATIRVIDNDVTVGYARFNVPTAQRMGEEEGILSHMWTCSFVVYAV